MYMYVTWKHTLHSSHTGPAEAQGHVKIKVWRQRKQICSQQNWWLHDCTDGGTVADGDDVTTALLLPHPSSPSVVQPADVISRQTLLITLHHLDLNLKTKVFWQCFSFFFFLTFLSVDYLNLCPKIASCAFKLLLEIMRFSECERRIGASFHHRLQIVIGCTSNCAAVN